MALMNRTSYCICGIHDDDKLTPVLFHIHINVVNLTNKYGYHWPFDAYGHRFCFLSIFYNRLSTRKKVFVHYLTDRSEFHDRVQTHLLLTLRNRRHELNNPSRANRSINLLSHCTGVHLALRPRVGCPSTVRFSY